jgi:beta-phosphoglucomutase-like phosphatase (HAD superfamily)
VTFLLTRLPPSFPPFPAVPAFALFCDMPLHGMILDIDGTLVDTNPAHVEAWRRAFERLGYSIPPERIRVEIGKGGDLLVPSILGEELEAQHGDALRKAQKGEFLKIAEDVHFRVFSCVPELFEALRERGIRTALATSSDKKHLQATMKSARIDLPSLAAVLVTKDDAEASKPEPDLLFAAIEKLDVSPARQPASPSSGFCPDAAARPT